MTLDDTELNQIRVTAKIHFTFLEETMKIDKKYFKRDKIDQYFRDGAELVINKENVAYVQVGSARYYFTGSPIKYKVTLLNGEKVLQTRLPYDGWERSAVVGVELSEEEL